MTKGRPLSLLHIYRMDGRGEEDQQREGEIENSLRDWEIITSATYVSTKVVGTLVMFSIFNP